MSDKNPEKQSSALLFPFKKSSLFYVGLTHLKFRNTGITKILSAERACKDRGVAQGGLVSQALHCLYCLLRLAHRLGWHTSSREALAAVSGLPTPGAAVSQRSQS